jgi:hypothetical protein
MVYQLQYKIPYEPMHASKALDGNLHDIRLEDETPEPGLHLSMGTRNLIWGRRIRPDHLPTAMQIGGGQRGVTDYDGYNGLTYVSPRFKVLIESIEPGVHQFFLLRLLDKAGNHLADHWVRVICNRIDSVDRANTTLVLKGIQWRHPGELSDGQVPLAAVTSQPVKLVFNSSQVGNAHFWRDKHILPGGLYCSDDAARQIAAAELTGIELIQAETV